MRRVAQWMAAAATSVVALAGCGSTAGVQVAATVAPTRPASTATTGTAAALPARTADPMNEQVGPADPAVGRAYPYDLLVHCGIRYARFGGRSWQTDRMIAAPKPVPDRSTGVTTVTGLLPGYMTLVSATQARFEAPGSGLTVAVDFHLMRGDTPLCA
jgi:hypothetical protein